MFMLGAIATMVGFGLVTSAGIKGIKIIQRRLKK